MRTRSARSRSAGTRSRPRTPRRITNYRLATGAVTATGGSTFTNNIGGTGTLTIPSITYNSGTAGTVTLRGTGTTTVTVA